MVEIMYGERHLQIAILCGFLMEDKTKSLFKETQSTLTYKTSLCKDKIMYRYTIQYNQCHVYHCILQATLLA